MRIFKYLKDILAPKKCYSCNKEGHFLCIDCLNKSKKVESICYVCKGKSNNFEVHKNCKNEVYYKKIIILSHYKDTKISKTIKNFKFYGKKDIGEDLGSYLGDAFLDNEIYKNIDDYIIIFPPMKLLNKLKRGYNHSQILANEVSKKTNIILLKSIIKKIKNTRQQSKLSRKERLLNLKNSFKINKKAIDNIDKKTFVIVDDVVSTGTTINEISKCLKESGAKKVIGLVIASD